MEYRKKLSKLPIERIEYELKEEERICPKCQQELRVMKKEVRKELIIIPAQVKIKEHVTYVYVCKQCDKTGIEGTIIKANAPKALIKKSMVSPSMMAYIMNQKYANAMPLYRQEQEFRRFGIFLSRQNLSNWFIKGASLLAPLLEDLKRELLSNDLLHADETVLEVLREPGREASTNSHMWLYRTSGSAKHPVILYDYQMGRSGKYANDYLAEWKGNYLHCDGWNGYKQLKEKTLCGCFVHARRKFYDAYKANPQNEDAKKGIEYIKKLFALEAKADELDYTYEQRHQSRCEKSKPILDEFYEWLDKVGQKTLPKSLLGKAICYAQNQKEYLSSFLKDGRIELSNNKAEQSIKMFVIGRKNFLFSNTPNGAKSSAIVYSILQTAIANGLKPYHYLEYIFTRIQMGQAKNVKEILPWSDKIPEECKNKEISQPQKS